MNIQQYMQTVGKQAREASRAIARADSKAKNNALRAIAAWAGARNGGGQALLIDHFQGSEYADIVFQAQASVLGEDNDDEDIEQQFRQIQLALRIRRKNQEFDVLMRQIAGGATDRDLSAELDRRAKELAELKRQRA